MAKKRVFLVRHGESTANRCHDEGFETCESSFQTPLTERGKEQAAKTARALRARFLVLNIRRLKIFSSPYRRCLRTAEALHEVYRKGIKITVWPLLAKTEESDDYDEHKEQVRALESELREIEDHVLIFAHSNVLSLLVSYIGSEQQNVPREAVFYVPNCSITELVFDQGRWYVESALSTEHLNRPSMASLGVRDAFIDPAVKSRSVTRHSWLIK